MTLSKKHCLFVEEYLKQFNATKAYLTVYPKSSYDSARANSARLLANDNISKEIQARLDEVHMSAEEALKLLADIARGDMARMMDVSSMGFNLDMKRAQELGLTKLIKRVKQRTTTFIAKKESEEDREVTELEVELYDALGAIRDVLKVHGKFTDRVDVMTGGESLAPKLSDEERLTRMKELALAIAKELNAGKPAE